MRSSIMCFALLASLIVLPDSLSAQQPNILWLTAEDIGPHLGCYGDDYADTPHLDEFANRSLTYLNAWSTAPVCAPARTTLISGMYPPSTGSEHMRSLTKLPENFHMYPVYMRNAGYFCINPDKEDYNLDKVGKVWDEADKKDPYAKLKANQPFMAVFNQTNTHESKIRTRPHEKVHDPAGVRVPAYHPDTPEVRQDWAQYYDNITKMDKWFGDQLAELERQGLADDTIVFFYGDHGSGMPRNKRWPYNSGLRVPLIIHVPEKFRGLAPTDYMAGGKSDQLVGFIDFAQTIISLAGAQPPEHMQGHAFMGAFADPPQEYAFGFRGRMDERYDMVRTVRNKRYIYLRHYMPHKVYGQYIDYMFVTPTTRKWKELYDAGELTAAQSLFWQTKPYEELYDLEADPDEVNNLAESAEHAGVLAELRKAHEDWVFDVKDVGFLPEDELHNAWPNLTPYEIGHAGPEVFPIKRIQAVAASAASQDLQEIPFLVDMLKDDTSAVRYWAAMGLLIRESTGVSSAQKLLRRMAKQDPSPSVRVIAAEGLGRYGDEQDVKIALNTLIECANAENHGAYVAMLALNSIDFLDDRAAPIKTKIESLPKKGDWTPTRGNSYVQNLIKKTLADLDN
ncbi:sulfatase-like hydrolase/transferase [Thalassoglobus sp. JC818]|uniref:sulfatase-like hydrolase/transferase n=1 Tax=Thalassoglobus sp. JC818 TaxID=3232136 RepID=UPI003459D726